MHIKDGADTKAEIRGSVTDKPSKKTPVALTRSKTRSTSLAKVIGKATLPWETLCGTDVPIHYQWYDDRQLCRVMAVTRKNGSYTGTGGMVCGCCAFHTRALSVSLWIKHVCLVTGLSQHGYNHESAGYLHAERSGWCRLFSKASRFRRRRWCVDIGYFVVASSSGTSTSRTSERSSSHALASTSAPQTLNNSV